MISESVRVRFAPSPTGIMHLGNIRAALMNFLYARQKNGTFILRIEDTDATRNYDIGAQQILKDLAWLDLVYDEGPIKNGPYAPYFQSERDELYKKHLTLLAEKNVIYRCFCTEQELEQKRLRQQALKLPPRYDRTCARLTHDEIEENLSNNMPFCWRFKLDSNAHVTIHDLARGDVTFEFKNFSDFLLTRTDGSFTFLFANFVDDMLMRITHVFRGEDHLSNTANQAAMYHAFNQPLPIYWHMPILCNTTGQKLSKRDFGFSLHDLQKAGYLPEAICNYLTIIGTSFDEEIMDMSQLIAQAKLDNPHTAGIVKYDVNKLNWLNRKWISLLDITVLAERCIPFLKDVYSSAHNLSREQLAQLLEPIRTDLTTLSDAVSSLKFYFESPEITAADFDACIPAKEVSLLVQIISDNLPHISSAQLFVENTKRDAQQAQIQLKHLFWFLRLALIGSTKGPAIHIIIEMLQAEESFNRIKKAIDLLTHN